MIQDALVKLIFHLKEIHTVQEWAECVGFESGKIFSEQFLKHFGQRPLRILVHIKLIYILELISIEPEISGYEIAYKTGLKDEKALYDFLSRHAQITISELRIKFRKK